MRQEHEALAGQLSALADTLGRTLGLLRTWTAVNDDDVAVLCELAAHANPDPGCAALIERVRALAMAAAENPPAPPIAAKR